MVMAAAAAAATVVVVLVVATQNKLKKRNCKFGLQKLPVELLNHQY
jgi:hypothetical protein